MSREFTPKCKVLHFFLLLTCLRSKDVHATRWTLPGAPGDGGPSPIGQLRTADRAARLGVRRLSITNYLIEAIAASGS